MFRSKWKCEPLKAGSPGLGVSGICESSIQRNREGGSLLRKSNSARIRATSCMDVGSGSVGPEASADSFPNGTSEMARVIFLERGAAAARRPPFTADKCLRMVLMDSMEAPQETNALCTACISASDTDDASGNSLSAEPPPESKKITSVFSSHDCRSCSMASAAFQLCWSGTGWPLTKYVKPGIVFCGFVGAATIPDNTISSGKARQNPYNISCAALPIAI